MDASWSAIMISSPGFGFHPSNEVLIKDYLRPKIMGTNDPEVDVIPTIDDLCKSDPSELQSLCWKPWNGNSEYCYFFCKWNQYGKGARCDRKTKTGYWKKTGKELDIIDDDTDERIGVRSILVFKGRNPGIKTKHIMHVYELKDHNFRQQSSVYVVCRLNIIKNKAKKTENKDDFKPGLEFDVDGWFSHPQDSLFFEGGEPSSSVSVNTTSSEIYAPLPPSETQEVHQAGFESFDSELMSIPDMMDTFYIPTESFEGMLDCPLDCQWETFPSLEWAWKTEMGYQLEAPQSSNGVDANGGLYVSVHELLGDFPDSS